MKYNHIVLTGGGTAGHVTVNINLQEELKKNFKTISYIGSESGIEKLLIKSNTDYNYYSINPTKLSRKKFFTNLKIPFVLLKSIKESKKILKTLKPDIVFSKGGYVALPVVIASKKLKIPVVCHESDITMGLANKIAKRYACKICTNFKITAEKNGSKCVYTGMPLKFANESKETIKEKFHIKTNKPILLITGGSLGAKAINNFVFNNIEKLTENYFVIHLTGKNNVNKNIQNNSYKQLEFCQDMWSLFKITDYAISRAGANTIIELLSNNILTIFVPLPKTNSRGDQIENAKYLENLGVSKTISQEDLSFEKVQNMLKFLKNNSKNIKNNIKNQIFTDGTSKIINTIITAKNI